MFSSQNSAYKVFVLRERNVCKGYSIWWIFMISDRLQVRKTKEQKEWEKKERMGTRKRGRKVGRMGGNKDAIVDVKSECEI